jgi:hypothetical protein
VRAARDGWAQADAAPIDAAADSARGLAIAAVRQGAVQLLTIIIPLANLDDSEGSESHKCAAAFIDAACRGLGVAALKLTYTMTCTKCGTTSTSTDQDADNTNHVLRVPLRKRDGTRSASLAASAADNFAPETPADYVCTNGMCKSRSTSTRTSSGIELGDTLIIHLKRGSSGAHTRGMQVNDLALAGVSRTLALVAPAPPGVWRLCVAVRGSGAH